MGVHRLSFVFQLSPGPMSQPSDLSTSQGLHLAQKSVNPILPNKKFQLILENDSTLVDFSHPS